MHRRAIPLPSAARAADPMGRAIVVVEADGRGRRTTPGRPHGRRPATVVSGRGHLARHQAVPRPRGPLELVRGGAEVLVFRVVLGDHPAAILDTAFHCLRGTRIGVHNLVQTREDTSQ